MPHEYWYVGTPYTKYEEGLDAAFRHACLACAQLIKMGYKVYCPIAHTHPVAIHGGINPRAHGIWMPNDEPLMFYAKGLIVVQMPGWDMSYGLSEEIEAFEKWGRPILWVKWGDYGLLGNPE